MRILKYPIIFAMLMAPLILISCMQKRQAEIEIKSPKLLSDSESSSYKKYKTPSQLKSAGLNYYLVKSNDNILTISKKLKVDIPIIVEINNMQPPYRLKSGDVLYLPSDAFSNTDEDEGNASQIAKVSEKKEVIESELRPVNKFIWPVKGKVVSKFGSKPGGIINNGINIKAAAGSEVRAVADGNVMFVGEDIKGYGSLVLIKHNSQWVSAYAHQKQIMVKKGDFVKQGDLIGHVGDIGDIKSPQLHFALRKDGKSVNPLNYISG